MEMRVYVVSLVLHNNFKRVWREHKRLQWKACGGENGQDVLVAREIVLLCCLSAQGKQFFIAVLTALAVTQSKSLFLTHLANGLTNFFILSHKEWCVYLKKNPFCVVLVFFFCLVLFLG